MANHFPPRPEWARALRSIGVTGTNGKTTTTRLLAAALSAHGPRPVARVTTVGTFLDDEPFPADEDYDGFLATMSACLERGGSLAALEVTSEALALGFAQAWPVEIGVFTNLSHDHLDAHRTPEHYLASKAQLFAHLPPGGVAVLNAFDEASALLAEVIPNGVRVLRYGVPSRGPGPTEGVDVLATAVSFVGAETVIELAQNPALALPNTVRVRALGEIYAENALAALTGAIAAGVPADVAARAISAAAAPPGRFETVLESPRVVVDYAHSPDALARTLATARALVAGTGGRVHVVFGAGGNRDRKKRGAMGAAAAVADRIVLTTDNPRDEDPRAIAEAIREGLGEHPGVTIELERAAAIELALAEAAPADVVVVAGKGHEATQTIGGRVVASSDRDLVLRARDRAKAPRR